MEKRKRNALLPEAWTCTERTTQQEVEGLLESVRAKTFNNFEIMGKDVHKDQIKYLTETQQPTYLATTKWCNRLAVINAGLVFLKKGAKPMSE